MTEAAIPARFVAAYNAVAALDDVERYLGAFVFGSVARGTATAQSDFDVRVMIDEDNPCVNINHPVIGGVKLDLTFNSLAQLRRDTAQERTRATRLPMIAESLIIFDKTGALAALRDEARQATPPQATPDDHQLLRFLIKHADDKVQRALDADPAAALFAMHLGLAELLDIDRRLHGRWEVSSKRLLADLRQTDPELATLIERFVGIGEIGPKFAAWRAIIAQVARPLQGWEEVENICGCAVCQQDIAALLQR
jgi:hypothetical protein